MFPHIFQLYLFAEKPLMLHLTLVKAFVLGDTENPLENRTVIISLMFEISRLYHVIISFPW